MATTELLSVEDMTERDLSESWELRDGVLIVMPPFSFGHSDIALGIGSALHSLVFAYGLGRVVGADGGFILSRNPDTLVAPDAAFVRADRLPPAEDRQRFAEVVPDLVVEVVSPGDRANEVEEKVQLYLDAGTSLVVVVYPRQRHVRTLSPDGASRLYRDGDIVNLSDVVADFRMPVAAIFV